MEGTVLDGLRVLDLSEFVAGPFCTKMLAEMGAQVIKAERPSTGDIARQAGPFPNDIPNPEASGLYLYLNTAKKSVTLDLSGSSGQEALRRLVAWADVLVESFPPGEMEGWGLGYHALQRINPGLIMASITPFGQTGPYRHYKATDLVTFAMGGLMSTVGDADRPPTKLPGPMTSYWAGVHTFAAIMVALFHRDLSGEGQYIDTSMMEMVGAHTNSNYLMWSHEGRQAPRRGNTAGFGGGFSQFHTTRDGGLIMVAIAPWDGLVELLGKPELAKDPRFASREARQQHGKELDEHLAAFCREHDLEEAFQMAQEKRLTWAPINTLADVFTSPQLQERGYFFDMSHPVAGALPYPGSPLKMGDAPFVFAPAPLLGQHNEEVYTGLLGYTKADLAQLREAGVV